MAAVQTLVALSNTYDRHDPGDIRGDYTAAPHRADFRAAIDRGDWSAGYATASSDPVPITAIQAGLLPTFYQFTEVDIALENFDALRQVTTTERTGRRRSGIFAFGSHVNFRTQNTYSYSVDASSSVTATLKPVPANLRLTPTDITVNALGKTPMVNVSQ